MSSLPGPTLALLVCGLLFPPLVARADMPLGVVVETIVPASAAGEAGLRTGDVLLAWSRGARPPANPEPAFGELRSPFDLEDVEIEQAPRGPVTLAVRRAGRELALLVPDGEWLLGVRPALQDAALAEYESARDQVASAATATGTSRWLDLAEREVADPQTSAWLLGRCAETWTRVGEWSALERFDRLAARLALASTPRVEVALELQRTQILRQRVQWDDAERAFVRTQTSLARAPGHELFFADVLARHAEIWRAQGKADQELELLRAALELRARHAPGSLALADSLRLQARHWTRRDQTQAEIYVEQALELCERIAPHSLTCARTHADAASAFELENDHDRVERERRRAVALLEELRPGSGEHVWALRQLAVMRWRVSDPEAGDELITRALDLAQRGNLPPETMGSLWLVRGLIAQMRGDLAEARHCQLVALADFEQVEPPGIALVSALLNVSLLEQENGDLAPASAHAERALAVAETLDVPARPYLAWALRTLAGVNIAQAALRRPRELCQRALSLDLEVVPGSLEEAEDHHCLARAARAGGDLADAVRQLGLGVAALEALRARASTSAERAAGVVAIDAPLRADYVEALADVGDANGALVALEAGRANALRTQLEERFDESLVPESLRQQRHEAEARLATQRAALARLPPETPATDAAARRSELHELRRRVEELAEQARRSAVRGDTPEALDLAGLRNALDPGTLLLAYSVGEERTLLLAAGASDSSEVEAFHVALGSAALRRRVDAFRSLLAHAPAPPARSDARAPARELFEALLRPVWPRVIGARRILIVADDVLLGLPFAALEVDGHFVAESTCVHFAPSVGVYAQLRARRPESASVAGARVAVFADPSRIGVGAALRSGGKAAQRSLALLGSLPAARREAKQIARLFAPAADLYLGHAATEERVRTLPRAVRIVHFASHAFADEQVPGNSAVVLGGDAAADHRRDGLLEAWEIATLELPAELVTLSGCETAWGSLLAGEGLQGLARAFLRAGARSVVGSLWRVSDESTAALMTRFYRELRAGVSKDEALRRAQVSLLHGRYRDPFYWAAFQLQGDWR